MRGLEARAALAQARSVAHCCREQEKYFLTCARSLAQELGYVEGFAGMHLPPMLFRDEPLLRQEWDLGQSLALELNPMPLFHALDTCPVCHGLLSHGDHRQCQEIWLDWLAS